MRLGRSHPILTAAVIGAAVGFAYVVAIEVGGAYLHNPHASVLMLWPTSIGRSGVSETTLFETALVLFIEFAANVLVYAALFAVPVALVVAIRRAFGIRRDS
jgi:hypothetical protein